MECYLHFHHQRFFYQDHWTKVLNYFIVIASIFRLKSRAEQLFFGEDTRASCVNSFNLNKKIIKEKDFTSIIIPAVLQFCTDNEFYLKITYS